MTGASSKRYNKESKYMEVNSKRRQKQLPVDSNHCLNDFITSCKPVTKSTGLFAIKNNTEAYAQLCVETKPKAWGRFVLLSVVHNIVVIILCALKPQ